MRIRGENSVFSSSLMAVVLLALACGLLFFYHIGKTDLDDPDSALMAVYARQMKADAAWLAPVVHAQPHFDILPGYLWGIRTTAFFADGIGDFETRLPGAISALLIIMLVSVWFFQHARSQERSDGVITPPEGFALLAGLMAATSPLMILMGRHGTPATMFALFYLLGAYCWGQSLEARRSFYAGWSWRSWLTWGYVFAGLAMLVGGPLVLPLLLVPYMLSARSYRLRRPSLVHLAGLGLVVVIGGWWFLAMTRLYPEQTERIFDGIWPFAIHSGWGLFTSLKDYLWTLVYGGFPWIIPALVMVFRVGLKLDRSPTLVFWMWSLVGNIIWLWLARGRAEASLLPVMPFVALLAAAGLNHWNFENAWASLWRGILRVSLLLGLAAGIFVAIMISSKVGLLLFVLSVIGWVVWMIRSHYNGIEYTPWETAVRLSAVTVVVIFAVELMMVANLEPRRRYFSPTINYFERVDAVLSNHGDARCYLMAAQMDPLYDYYLEKPPILEENLGTILVEADANTFLFAKSSLDSLDRNPRLRPVTHKSGATYDEAVEKMFQVLPEVAAGEALAPDEQPLRFILIGNSGTRSQKQRDVGYLMDKYADSAAATEVLMLGNNIYGQNVVDHLDFVGSFETPYRRLLKRGVSFHAVLGHEDQGYAKVQLRYGPFNMDERRYYSRTFAEGLVEVFMLDSERLRDPDRGSEAREQLAWLDQALARSRATWKVVGLYRGLSSNVRTTHVDTDLAAELLPLFDRYAVDVVAWAGGTWYERLQMEGRRAVFFNAGWSGTKERVSLKPQTPTLQAFSDERPGFMVMDFTPEAIHFMAINDKREIKDEGLISKGGYIQAVVAEPVGDVALTSGTVTVDSATTVPLAAEIIPTTGTVATLGTVPTTDTTPATGSLEN